MKFGVPVGREEIQKAREWKYIPKDYTPEPDEEMPTFWIKPWTRTLQGLVDKRARAMNIAIMDANEALKGVGTGDKKAEAYVRVLADTLIVDWKNVVFTNDFTDPETGESYKTNDPLPCEAKFKVFVFENTDFVVSVLDAAKSFASSQIEDEAKNSARSSVGEVALAT